MRFGEYLRNLRERRNWLLREVAAKTNMDTALLSKIERGHRNARKEQVYAFAKAYKIDPEELNKRWLVDKVIELLKDEENPQAILNAAEKEINQMKKDS